MDPDSSARRTGLTVAVTDDRGRARPAPGLAAWLQRVAPRNAPPAITIALVSDARIRALNRRFRRTDAVTDVLSFEPSDLAIATGRARRQAREAGHSYATELKVLALHGLLHLSGFDHHHPDDRGRMSRFERRLRLQGGLHEGLIERAARTSEATRSEPRDRSEPATLRQAGRPERSRRTKRRASARAGEPEGRRPPAKR